MDATIITVVSTGVAVTALVSRSIGNLRSHMDQRIDALIHGNQQAHDTIGLRIETQGGELRERIDAQREELCKRIDAQGEKLGRQGEKLGERIDALDVRLARTSEDVSFIKGRLTADGTG